MIKQYFGKHIDLSKIVAVSGPYFIHGIHISCDVQLMDKPVKIYIPTMANEMNGDYIPTNAGGEICKWEDSVAYKRVQPLIDQFIEDWKECCKLEKQVAQSLFIIKEVAETARQIQEAIKDKQPYGELHGIVEDTGEVKELFAMVNGEWKRVNFISIDRKKEVRYTVVTIHLRESLIAIDDRIRIKWRDDKYEYGAEDSVYVDYSECDWTLKWTLGFNPDRRLIPKDNLL